MYRSAARRVFVFFGRDINFLFHANSATRYHNAAKLVAPVGAKLGPHAAAGRNWSQKIGANFVLFVLSRGGSPPAVSPLSQTVDEEGGDRGAGGRDVGGFEGGVVEGELAIMGGLVWDDVGGQVTSPLIGLHSICQ